VERKSPPTERVIRVLNLVAAHPRQRFTVSELARRLDITKATCLAIAGTLAQSGYLVRDDTDRTYGLGPVLLTLGGAAQDSFASLEVARPHLRRITERFGTSCTASTVIGDDIVVLERTGLPGVMDSAVKVGQRYPYAPPSGVVFAVWQPDQAIDHWLAGYPPVPIDRDRLGQLAASCRRLGYLVERLSEVSVASYTLLAGLTRRPPGRHDSGSPPALAKALNDIVAAFPYRYYLERDLRAPGRLPVSVICSPTYSAQRLPDLLLAGWLLRDTGVAEIERHGSALRDAAAAVTAAAGGRNPWTATDETAPRRPPTAGGRPGGRSRR
jgi:DNA-binding IclR family transcriptional regulator